jgi:hypothetical protein
MQRKACGTLVAADEAAIKTSKGLLQARPDEGAASLGALR